MNPLREWIEEELEKWPGGGELYMVTGKFPPYEFAEGVREGWKLAMDHVLNELKSREDVEHEAFDGEKTGVDLDGKAR